MSQKLIFLFFLLCNISLKAQESLSSPDTISTYLTARYDEKQSGVLLRWEPSNWRSFQHCTNLGYTLVRSTIFINGEKLPKEEVEASKVNLGNFQVNKDQLNEQAQGNKYAKVLFSAFFDDKFEVNLFSETDAVRMKMQQQEKQMRMDFGLLAVAYDFELAVNAKLGFIDQQVQIGHDYKYELIPKWEPNEEKIWLINSVKIVSANPKIPADYLPAPNIIQTNSGDLKVNLLWDLPNSDNFISFSVQQSDLNANEWYTRNASPIIPSEVSPNSNTFSYDVSVNQNEVDYEFRVYGLDVFGLYSPFSNVVIAHGKTPPIDANPDINSIKPTFTSVDLEWKFPTTLNNKITKFILYASAKLDGPYTIFKDNISKTARAYSISNAPAYMYYKIIAMDIYGNEKESFAILGQLKDETPPVKPEIPICTKKGDDGDLSITWKANKDNDLMGYRLFASDRSNGNFIQFTPTWTDSTFYEYKVNVNTLNKYAYFKVAALDYRENMSVLSEACIFKIPDVIPPANPNITNIEAKSKGVQLTFEFSPSEDVVKHLIERRLFGAGTQWETISTITSPINTQNNPNINTILDSMVSFNTEYIYRVTAIDDSNLSSFSQLVRIIALGAGFRDNPTDGQACYINKVDISQTYTSNSTDVVDNLLNSIIRETVILKWSYNYAATGLNDFLIFRSNEINSPVTIASVDLKQSKAWSVIPPTLLGKIDCITYNSTPKDDDILIGGQGGQSGTHGYPYINLYNFKSNDFYFLDSDLIPAKNVDKDLYYWVMARYQDGTTSELIGPIKVHIP